MSLKLIEERLAGIPDDLYSTKPPRFGHDMHKLFGFDPKYTNLNHGSYGSMPLPVRRYVDQTTTEIESNPDLFVRFTCKPRLDAVRARLAALIGASPGECAIMPNTSHALCTILQQNIAWETGDIILAATTTYGQVVRALDYLQDHHPNHPRLSILPLRFPSTHAEIIAIFEAHVKTLKLDLPKGSKIVAVIDSIASNPGVVLPWKEIVSICRAEGVMSVIDGAHSIGQEVGINLTEAQPDFWVSNCHKWLYAKRGCAVMYVPKRNQHLIGSSFPTSHEYQPTTGLDPPPHFIVQFDWNGTIDFAGYLSVAAALDFRSWLGGEEKINAYCNTLAIAGGKCLAEIFGTYVLDDTPNNELTASMVNVRLPLPSSLPLSVEVDITIKRKLILERNMYAAHYVHDGHWWVRCSAQIWNEIGDFEVLGTAFVEVCKEIVKEFPTFKAHM